VEKHQVRAGTDIMSRLRTAGPRAAKGRASTPAVLRDRRLSGQPVDDTGAQTEDWTIGYLTDVILTRDTWMHRSDIALAAGLPMRLSADHDGVLVGDVAAEWAQRHGEPCSLTLTGPAGGTWTWGSAGPALELDAVEFCRILSGRGGPAAADLLATRVPF